MVTYGHVSSTATASLAQPCVHISAHGRPASLEHRSGMPKKKGSDDKNLRRAARARPAGLASPSLTCSFHMYMTSLSGVSFTRPL